MSSFEKIENTDRCMYGPRRLLLCGFTSQDQSKFKALLKMIGVVNLPLIWVGPDQVEQPIRNLLELPDGTGDEKKSLPKDLLIDRAIILSGIFEKELHQLMSGYRQVAMGNALWAVLTPTSEKWTMKELIAELKAERAAMAKKKQQKDGD